MSEYPFSVGLFGSILVPYSFVSWGHVARSWSPTGASSKHHKTAHKLSKNRHPKIIKKTIHPYSSHISQRYGLTLAHPACRWLKRYNQSIFWSTTIQRRTVDMQAAFRSVGRDGYDRFGCVLNQVKWQFDGLAHSQTHPDLMAVMACRCCETDGCYIIISWFSILMVIIHEVNMNWCAPGQKRHWMLGTLVLSRQARWRDSQKNIKNLWVSNALTVEVLGLSGKKIDTPKNWKFSPLSLPF